MKAIISEYHTWDTDFRIGNHHYARAFIDAGWDVLWVSHPVSPFHVFKSENSERMKLARSGPTVHANGPIELVPYTLLPFIDKPMLRSKAVIENSGKFFTPPLKRTLEESGFDEPDLLWITDTVMHTLIDSCRAKFIAVRIADDNVEFKGSPNALKWAENRLCERADAIFATSHPLEKKLKKIYGEKTHLLRNGVEFDRFQGEFPRPKEFENINGPIAIYVGAIEEWFEPDWVVSLAENHPELTICLIGRIGITEPRFQNKRNILALGSRPYETIPGYLVHSDVGIIPFRRTRLVESISPLKLYEFFASGLPVVSTSWNELEDLSSPAMLVHDYDEFSESVLKAVNESMKKNMQSEYREFAQANSWDSRFRDILEILKVDSDH
ncbi:MAG: glycosyltransferase [bacterium]